MNNINPSLFKSFSEDWETVEITEKEYEEEAEQEESEEPEGSTHPPVEDYVDRTMECDEVDPVERALVLASRAKIPVEMRQSPKFGQIVYQKLWRLNKTESTNE